MALQVLQPSEHTLAAMALKAFWLLWRILLGLLEHVVATGCWPSRRLHHCGRVTAIEWPRQELTEGDVSVEIASKLHVDVAHFVRAVAMTLPGGRRELKKLGTPAKSAGSKELRRTEARLRKPLQE